MKQSLIFKRIFILLLIVICLFLNGCAKQDLNEEQDPPGFFSGLLHGFIILFSFIGSFFTDYEIYAFPNSGGWYNFGFLLGVSIIFGGSGAGACKYRE